MVYDRVSFLSDRRTQLESSQDLLCEKYFTFEFSPFYHLHAFEVGLLKFVRIMKTGLSRESRKKSVGGREMGDFTKKNLLIHPLTEVGISSKKLALFRACIEKYESVVFIE